MVTGYKPIIKAAVYGRDDTAQVFSPEPGSKPRAIVVRKLFLPSRYTQPTEDDVVEYLTKRAESKTLNLELPAGTELEGETDADGLLRNLPDKIKRDIRSRDPDCIKFIRINTRAYPLKEGESRDQYLHIRYGILPLKVIQANEESISTGGRKWYVAAFLDDGMQKNGFGQRLVVRLLLQNGILPEKTDIEVLLKHRTHGSRTLEIDRERYNIQEAGELVDAVYAELPVAGDVKCVEDVSETVLEEHATEPLMAFHRMITKQVIEQRLSGNHGQKRHPKQ